MSANAESGMKPFVSRFDAANSPRAKEISSAYWVAMLAASALGTNLGDLWGNVLLPGLASSLASLLAICAVAVWYDRWAAERTEAGYWIAVVAMRAAATNLADILTHELLLSYVVVAVLLSVLTLAAARFTVPDPARGGSPRVDSAYWVAMFIAGLFGTVAGDLMDHQIGLYAGAGLTCLLLGGLIVARNGRAPDSIALYWLIIMTERCAGTAIGDALASRHAVGLGLKLATASMCVLLAVCLWLRARVSRQMGAEAAPATSVLPSP